MFGNVYLKSLIEQLKYRVTYNQGYLEQNSPIDTVQKLQGLDVSELLVLINLTTKFLQVNYNLVTKCSRHLRYGSKLIDTIEQGKKFDKDFEHLIFELKDLYENFSIYERTFKYFEGIAKSGQLSEYDNPTSLATHVESGCSGFERQVKRFSELIDFVLREHRAVENFRTYLNELFQLVQYISEDVSQLDKILKEFEQMKLS